MIIVKLMGGLGNQMFQYATARALSQRLGSEVFVDETFLLHAAAAHTLRVPELQQFRLDYRKAGDTLLKRAAPRRIALPGRKFHRLTDDGRFNSAITAAKGNVYLDGYWQSEQYFEAIRNLLLGEFAPRYDLDREAGGMLEKISTSRSVSVHVRRGDYVTLPEASAFHGVLPLEYYKTAMQMMREKHGDVKFFVFSDEMHWCRGHFEGGDIIFSEANSGFSSVDMLLMSRCSHHIIANSSYSWWGAWLGNREGTVIAPERWYKADHPAGHTIQCEGWIRI